MVKTALLLLLGLTPFAMAGGCAASTSPSVTTITASTSCRSTRCADYINSCGQTYGGCYQACSGFTTPKFTDPGCPTTTSTASMTTSTSSCGLICKDYFDDCGNTYGPGCYPSCSPEPTYTTPYCSEDVTTTAPPYVRVRATNA